MPARETLDYRAIQVLFELIARNDEGDAIQGAIRARERIARAEGDDALARWLDDAALRLDFAKRHHAEHMQDGEALIAACVQESGDRLTVPCVLCSAPHECEIRDDGAVVWRRSLCDCANDGAVDYLDYIAKMDAAALTQGTGR